MLDCNFFQLEKGRRYRVTDILDISEIEANPEKFSPNVLLRPLYQEMVLPNLAYVGGGAGVVLLDAVEKTNFLSLNMYHFLF